MMRSAEDKSERGSSSKRTYGPGRYNGRKFVQVYEGNRIFNNEIYGVLQPVDVSLR